MHGSVAEGLEPVKELFLEQFNKGEELSAQVDRCWIVITTVSRPILNDVLKVCVYLKGEKVVDLAGSSVDPAYNADSLQVCKKRERAVRDFINKMDPIFHLSQTIWSSTKNLTALAMACLVDRGLLSYSDK